MTVKPTYEELEQRIKELESESVEAKPTQEEFQEVEEKLLRESEEKYRTLFDNMTQGAFRQRADGVLVDVNTAALKMFGLTKNEFLFRTSETPAWDVVHEDGSLFPGTEHPSMMALRTGKPVLGVVAGVRNQQTGDRVWMEVNAIPEFRPGASKPFRVMVTMHNITQRKQAAKVLQESENAYRTLAENLPGMVYRVFVRENNRMEFFNKMLQPMTGYRIGELTAGEVCSIEPLILSEDREAVVTAVERALQDHQPFEVEYRLRNRRGETRYFLERGRPIYGEDGNPLYIDGVILDVSARKVAEEALRKLDQEKAVILNATVEGMGLVDTSLKVVWANQVFGDHAGLPLEKLPGHYCYEIWAGRSNACVDCPILKTIETGRSEEAEIRSPDGRIWLHQGYPIKNASGQIENVVATAVDITERKRAEEALLFKENIVRHSSSVIATCDLEGKMTYGNLSFFKAWGFDNPGEFLGRPFGEFWLVEDRRDEIMRVLRDDGTWFGEIKGIRKDGSLFDVQVSAATVFDSAGNPVALTSTSIDITERKRAEQRVARLTKLYSVLSQVNEAIVRTHDEGQLYTEVCRIVAEEGGFPLVWIGQIKGRQVAPAAFHGPAADYLKEIRVAVEGELGNGPTGTCIRENRPVINDDFDTNPSTRPWRKPALTYGFRASAAFPLRRQDVVVGAITLYAPEPGTFDVEQRKLLESLCADISYALDAMQHEKLRSEAEETLRHQTLELQQLTETLEARVQERTAELAAINEELRVENEERLRVEIELRESEDRLRELSKALLSAQERERKLIAQEIHDSMGASLAAVKFKVESALTEIDDNKPQARASLANIIPIVQGTIDEARRIQMSLRPSILDDIGILATITWLCRQFQSTYSRISIKQEIDIQENEVPESLKIVIYRVLQEALNNIAKHSKASVVFLNLQKAKSAIRLVIRDSGQGFDLDEAYSRKGMTKGLGLDSMRERTELSGGSFSIESRKGAGTVIRAAWPINQLSS